MSAIPIVTWTTPHMRAERALLAAGEHLTFRRIPEAKVKLNEMMEHVRELVAQIEREEAEAAEIEHRRHEWMRRTGEPGR